MIISLWRYVGLYICTLDRLKEDSEEGGEGGDKATTQKRAKIKVMDERRRKKRIKENKGFSVFAFYLILDFIFIFPEDGDDDDA